MGRAGKVGREERLIKWVEQYAKGISYDELSFEEIKALLKNKHSQIVVLFYPLDIKLANLFKIIPNEYAGFGGIVGKKYEAVKDYLKWNGLDVAKYTPLLVKMGEVLASEINQRD